MVTEQLEVLTMLRIGRIRLGLNFSISFLLDHVRYIIAFLLICMSQAFFVHKILLILTRRYLQNINLCVLIAILHGPIDVSIEMDYLHIL
jgi:hypothetical protein